MLKQLQKTFFDISLLKKTDWFQKATAFCKKNAIYLESPETLRQKAPFPTCLGGGGATESTFRIFNAQGPSILKIYHLRPSQFTEIENFCKRLYVSQFTNLLIPYKLDVEGDFLFIQRRFIPNSLSRRLRFDFFLIIQVVNQKFCIQSISSTFRNRKALVYLSNDPSCTPPSLKRPLSWEYLP